MKALASRAPNFRKTTNSYFGRKKAREVPEVKELWSGRLFPSGREQMGSRYLPAQASHRAREEKGKLSAMCLRPSLLRVR